MSFKKALLILILFAFSSGFARAAQNDSLRKTLHSNVPKDFLGFAVPEAVTNLLHQNIDSVVNDFDKIGFSEATADWKPVNDFLLYDSKTSRKAGNIYYVVFKTKDNQKIGLVKKSCSGKIKTETVLTLPYHPPKGLLKDLSREDITTDSFRGFHCR